MQFHKKQKTGAIPDEKRYAVYMQQNGCPDKYVCDMVDGDGEEAAAINKLGLNLRTRLTRSQGRYAMLEGEIFDPERLVKAVCSVTSFETEAVKDKTAKGHTRLTVTADGITNTYLVFDSSTLDSLIRKLEELKE